MGQAQYSAAVDSAIVSKLRIIEGGECPTFGQMRKMVYGTTTKAGGKFEFIHTATLSVGRVFL